MAYNFNSIEQKWQKKWKENNTYRVDENSDKKKYYVLNMFPYPSGAGLHVGHPLGYIASDIFARFKRLQGFNVLNPMGYDAYGLPAEQYAIQTGQHPAITTEQNINRYREQLDKIGFCFDWSREIRTCDSNYYHWTQWTFIKMFNSYYDNKTKSARPIAELIEILSKEGSAGVDAACTNEIEITANEWNSLNETEKEEMHFKMEASVAIQSLPGVADDEELCRIVDEVIAYIAGTGYNYFVGPFETTIEGERYDDLMDIARECLKVAVQAGAPKVSAYIKAVYCPDGDILTIAQKTGKYQ